MRLVFASICVCEADYKAIDLLAFKSITTKLKACDFSKGLQSALAIIGALVTARIAVHYDEAVVKK